MWKEQVIIAITADKADVEQIKRICGAQTGDTNPFFCPEIHEGEPYDGHLHAFPPEGVTNPSTEPILLKSGE